MAALCPVFQEPQFTDNGEFLVGGLLWFYEAGTSTLAIAYTTEAGDVAWPNPIVLDSRGECAGTIWLAENTSYRITLESKPAYGQVHGVIITEHDDITGIASAQTPQDWVTFVGAPTFDSTTSFTVIGDYRDVFVANRKLRITDSGGVSIHSVTSSSFVTSTTTVNVTGLIDSGISLVEYSFVTPDASPDRFEDLIVNDAMTVSGNSVLDGNVTVGGTLTVGGNAAWTNANNTFGTSTSPNTGSIRFANGVRFYRETKAITFTSSGSTIKVSYSDEYATPFATTCFQVLATLGDIDPVFGQNSPIVSVKNVTANGFDFDIICKGGVSAGTYNLTLIYLAIGY